MKKIINKILLVLCISFISIFCIASNEKSYTNVNAETSVEKQINIKMANLSYEDCIYIDYAIEYSGFGNDFDQNKIELLFWEKPQDTYEKGTEYYSRKK